MDNPDPYVHYEDPFMTPADRRAPERRFRGRLAAPVTLWTAGDLGAPAGLTVSSLIVAEGAPSLLLGLVTDTTDFFGTLEATRAFIAHVLEDGDQVLADRFAGLRPSPGGLFREVETLDSRWGPVLKDATSRAYCKVKEILPAGYQQLVVGEIERLDLDELDEPLVYFRGRYRRLQAR
jgi:3-hydroxy-9,10-secoandrosta-1,3,5(10)-triene-9,17-dione monooxygenase reductase component